MYYGHRKKKFDNSKSGHFNTTVKVKNSRTNINNKPSKHVCGYSCNDDCFGNNSNSMRYQGNYSWQNQGSGSGHNHSASPGTIDPKQPFVATFFIIKT